MAPAVAYVAAKVGTFFLAAGASTTVATAAYHTAAFLMTYVVPSLAVNMISRALTKRPSIPSVRAMGTEVNVRDPAAPRQIIYGQRRVSGVFYPVGTSGTNNEFLHVLVLLAGHECEELGAVTFNDEVVPLDGSGNATGRYAGFVRIKKHLGAHNQTVDTDLQTDLGSSYWTNNHRLQGIAHLYVRLKVSADLFPGGIPEIYCLVKGRKVYDARDSGQDPDDASTWEWSNNAALCLVDWVRGVPTRNGAGAIVRNYGVGAPDSEVNFTDASTAANISDETVGLSAGQGSFSCATTSGTWEVTESGGNYTLELDGSYTALWNGDQATFELEPFVSGGFSQIAPQIAVAGNTATFNLTGALLPNTQSSWAIRARVFTTQGGTVPTYVRDTGTFTVNFGGASSEPRYTCNGVMPTSTLPADGIELLKSAMAGDCVYISGKWVVFAGAYRTPTLPAFDESDLRAPLSSVRLKPATTEIFNVGRGLYVSAQNNWQPTDLPEVRNATYKAQDGGEDLPLDLEFPFTTSSAAGQRLLKIAIERSRQGIAFVAKCKLNAWQVRAGDVIPWTDPDLGWSSKPFEVLGVALVAEEDANGQPYLGVDLTLKETASAVWDWNDGEETIIDPAPNTSLRSPFDIANPTALSVTNSVQQQSDGTTIPRLLVSWTAPADANVTARGGVRVEYKLAAASDWLPVDFIRGEITSLYILAVVIGQSYDVRVRSETEFSKSPTWVTHASVAVVGDTTAPSQLSAPSVTAFPGYNRVAWAKSTADDIAEYRVYRNTSNTTSGATLLGETDSLVWDDPNVTPGTTYYYFVSPLDGSENEGTASTGTSVVTSNAPVGAAVPNAPSAASKTAEGTYSAGDGTVFAFLTINVPALPANAVWQTLLYRRSGATDWLVAAQLKNASTTSVRLDDLSPGVSYEVASQAWSGAGGSAITGATSSPFLAPNTTSGPAAPAWGELSGSAPARRNPSGTGFLLGCRVTWAAVNDPALVYYELKSTTTDSDSATDYNWGSTVGTFPNTPQTVKQIGTTFVLYSDSPAPNGYVRVRAVNATGVASSWLRIGDALSFGVAGAGSLALESTAPVSKGGTGATDASGARSNLGLGSLATENTAPVAKGGTGATDASGARGNLGLGSMATQNANSVAITGGTINGCSSTGVAFDGAHTIKLLWDVGGDGHVSVWVDGSRQGTIPNP